MDKKTQWIVLGILLLIACGFTFYAAGTEYSIVCSKDTNVCQLRERSFSDSESSLIGQFRYDTVIDVFVDKRMDKDDNFFYDLGLDYGKDGKYYIGFGFNTLIKANTAKMLLKAFIDNQNKEKVKIKKDCYFNKYWCI